jgi:broad specificity phosphatase PhoE
MPDPTAVGVVGLWLVRHGESTGNVAASAAIAAGQQVIGIDLRDADVPLTTAGRDQASAVGRSFAEMTQAERPDVVWSSPYLRTRQTARLISTSSHLPAAAVDERLRDRELGILDLLTSTGVEARFPEEAARRRWLGKLYYRPPGGESWADVALRLRSFLADLDRLAPGQKVLLVVHDAVILLLRYVCEALSEDDLLDMASTTTVGNASLTHLTRPSGRGIWAASGFNIDEHLREQGAPVTEHSGDSDVRPR